MYFTYGYKLRNSHIENTIIQDDTCTSWDQHFTELVFFVDLLQQVMWQVDSILFRLLVLHALCDSQGRVWRAHPCHLYAVEATLPKVGVMLS